jgi:hypothetical protein
VRRRRSACPWWVPRYDLVPDLGQAKLFDGLDMM